MAVTPNKNWEIAMGIEQELQVMVKQPDVLYDDIDHRFGLLRFTIKDIILDDIQNGRTSGADSLLWDITCAINDRFRRGLARLKNNDRRTAVEKHKMAQRCANFIKTSSHFYKYCIPLIDASFGGIIDLQKIAHKLDLTQQSVDEQHQSTAPGTETAIIGTVHIFLVHLGDLSRWRNELRKDKVWDLAMTYYALAVDLMPTDGSAYNQMAVVSLQVNNHLDAVYYFYRALAIDEPHPRAKRNIELEFKKLLSQWKNNIPSVSSANHSNAESVAISWLLRLHAMLYKCDDLSNHNELETEVICQTTALLKDQSLHQDILNKFALINIAAEYLALERLKESETYDNKMSYFGLLRLNIRTLFMILQVLQPEFLSDDHENLPGNKEQPEKITPVMRHLLPAFRHYSTWLVSQATNICSLALTEGLDGANMEFVGNLRLYIKELWQEYASTLCHFCGVFPPSSVLKIPEIEYLLEEDVTTLGFKPFTDQEIAPRCGIHSKFDGTPKPRRTDQGVRVEEPTMEMKYRIKDIIRDGVAIAVEEHAVPIRLADQTQGVFYFEEETVPNIRPTHGHSPGRSMSSLEMKRTLSQRDEARGYGLSGTVLPDEELTQHHSVDQRMKTMVEELINTREDTYGMDTRAANELFAGVQTDYNIQSSGRLPNHGASGFAPRAPEHSQYAQRGFSTVQSRQLAEADTLDAITRGGVHASRIHIPQHSIPNYNENVPNSSRTQTPAVRPGGKLTESELDYHVHLFNNPFSSSSWMNNSNVLAGTDTPFKSSGKLPKPVGHAPSSLLSDTVGNQDMSSSVLRNSGLASSGHGLYGDSRSYERQMMLQSSLPYSGYSQMQTPPPGQGSGQG